MSEILHTIADIEILLVFICAVVFTISYVTFFRWRKTQAGRAVLYIFVASLLISLTSLIIRLVDVIWFPWREIIRLIGWSAMLFATVNIVRVLWHGAVRGKSALDLKPRIPRDRGDQ